MESVQVEIYGQVYTLKGGTESAHIRELASYVDQKMKEIEKGTGTVDSLRVAILAALTITDELHRMRDQYGELEMAADQAVKSLLDLTKNVSEAQQDCFPAATRATS